MIRGIGRFSALKAQAQQLNLTICKLNIFVKNSSLDLIYDTMLHESVKMKSKVLFEILRSDYAYNVNRQKGCF